MSSAMSRCLLGVYSVCYMLLARGLSHGRVEGALNDTKQRLQEVEDEHAREKQDWQQQQQDWQQQHQDLQHRQQDWQQQHQDWQQRQQDWQQRQQDWQQQQQLLEKQLHDLLQQADIHAHIIVVSAANELARLKEQLNVAQARLAHQASGAEQLQQSVVRLTAAVCAADARAVAAEASSIAAAAVAADASSDAHASAALLEQERQLNAALLEETELLHQHVAIADAATMAAMADAEDKGVGKACAFVTDTPSTNKAAWRLVEQRHPKVLSVGCWMHILDLYLHGTPVAIALSWLKRQQELQQEEHCQAWMAGSRELLAEAIPLFKARWRYGDSQVLYLAAILDPRYKMLDFQFSPAQFSQAEQALSRLVTVDDSQADQPVAMALEQLRRGWGAPPSELLSRTQLSPIHFAPHLTAHPLQWWAERRGFAPLLQAAAQRVLCSPATAAANERVFSSFKHIWSDKRSSLLLGRMWLLAFIYFNKRVLERRPKPQPEAEWQQFAQWMQHMPVEA
ncbi:hypothetical protein QJQ45_007383 [Haematococcus lacustris]|nr:hypothetical protein QJQ45_007383 [Haematococcus lacustris]